MGRFEFRYFNGQRWTSDVSISGQRFVDNLDAQQPISAQPGWGPSSAASSTERHRPSRAYALASFWVALGAVLCGWVPFIFVVAIGGAVAAFIFGVLALRREKRHPAGARGYAIAGIVLAVAALGSSGVGYVFTRSVLREVNAFLAAGPHSVQIDSCTTSGGVTVLDGSITNDDNRTHGYTISVSYRAGDKVLDSDEIAVPSVAAGQTAAFHATGFPETNDVECRVDSVRGPNPFTQTP